jgi:hypothetical protein
VYLAVGLVLGPIAKEFRRSNPLNNSFNAEKQIGAFKRLSQNAIFASSADRKPALFHGGSGGGVDSAVGPLSGVMQ